MRPRRSAKARSSDSGAESRSALARTGARSRRDIIPQAGLLVTRRGYLAGVERLRRRLDQGLAEQAAQHHEVLAVAGGEGGDEGAGGGRVEARGGLDARRQGFAL